VASNKEMKFLLLLAPALCMGAILPDTIGPYHQAGTTAVTVADKPLWDEYGLRAAESTVYVDGASKFTVTAYQLQDSTGAMAAFEWQRPEKARDSKLAPLAVETPKDLLLAHGNYILNFAGYKPQPPELEQLYGGLKNVDLTSLPTLPGHLPDEDVVAGSERYVIGPEGLAKFDPGIPPAVAAFHLGAEASIATFHSSKGDLRLAIFEYPTFQIAMQRIVDFQKLPGAVAKRSGPLVAVTLSPPDPNEAERLLDKVQYHADVTMQQHIPTKKDNIGDLVVNAFILTGLLLIIPVAGGLMVGGVRLWQRRGSHDPDANTIVSLHL